MVASVLHDKDTHLSHITIQLNCSIYSCTSLSVKFCRIGSHVNNTHTFQNHDDIEHIVVSILKLFNPKSEIVKTV